MTAIPELQATSNACSDSQRRQPRLQPPDRAHRAYANLRNPLLQLKPSITNTQIHHPPSCLVRRSYNLVFAAYMLTGTLVIQEAQATTDTSPSSRTKAVYTKSVRIPSYHGCPSNDRPRPRLPVGATTNMISRVCIQGDYGSKHHIIGRAGQGLCSSHLAEEGACTYGKHDGPHEVLTHIHRTSSSTPPPYPTSSACRPQLVVS